MSAILLLLYLIAPYAGIALLITGIVQFVMARAKKDAGEKERLRRSAVRYLLAGALCLLLYICFVLWLRAHPPGV
jgi:uncharacterized membrane protein HdeD (DUF308 family)